MVSSSRQYWAERKEAHQIFELVWYEERGDAGEPPCERQVDYILASGLPSTRYVGDRARYEEESLRLVAKVHAQTDAGRVLHALEDGPWGDVWRLHRRYSENGVVVLGNTAYAEHCSHLPLRTLQRLLFEGLIPSSKIGYTYFLPLKALESYLRERRPSAQEVSVARQPRRGAYLDGITADVVKSRTWPA